MQDMQNKTGWNGKLFGDPTLSSASGVAFSLATVLPTLLSLLFFIVIGAGDYTQTDWYIYVSYLLPQIAFAITAVWFLCYLRIPVKSAVTSQKCHPRYFLIAMLLQVGLFSLSELNALFLQFLENFGYKDQGILLPSMDGFAFVGVLLVVAVLPALFEEIFFRGILLKGLKSFGEVGSVLVCGALFALYHQNPAQTLYQFCCGVGFALVALRAGSFLPTILSHFFNNALILLLAKLGIESFSAPTFAVVMLVSAVCLIGALVWIFALDKRKEKHTEKTETDMRTTEQKRFFLYASVGIAICAITWLAVLLTGL